MKKWATCGLLALGYGLGIVVAILLFSSDTRYECYDRHGATGILWCPESGRDGPALLRKSAIWPYYVYRAITGS